MPRVSVKLSTGRRKSSAVKNPWFHLMLHKDHPDDFREGHLFLWVDVDASLLRRSLFSHTVLLNLEVQGYPQWR